ncbi:hypothetical protein AOLI_G00142480 [Acnodon oligacanthus]
MKTNQKELTGPNRTAPGEVCEISSPLAPPVSELPWSNAPDGLVSVNSTTASPHPHPHPPPNTPRAEVPEPRTPPAELGPSRRAEQNCCAAQRSPVQACISLCSTFYIISHRSGLRWSARSMVTHARTNQAKPLRVELEFSTSSKLKPALVHRGARRNATGH